MLLLLLSKYIHTNHYRFALFVFLLLHNMLQIFYKIVATNSLSSIWFI